ncbi:MAG: CoB--CoM heterodisulfide reductase iron-sulfur subunit B family protein [Promethearchaeota archaeon]
MDALMFNGCVIPNRLPFIEKSARLVFNDLGVNLIDAPFNCCPDPVGIASISEKTWLTLGARNLAIGEKQNKKIISFCNGCSETLIGVKYSLSHNKEDLKEVNKILKKKGYSYKGNAQVSHFVRSLIEDIGIDKIKKLVKKPLNGLKVATHTGCHYARPSDWIQWDDPLDPKCLDELVMAVGAEPVKYTEKTLCCGSAVDRTNSKIALEIARRKLQSIADAGAQCIVLNCPSCFQQFDTVQRLVNKEFGTNFKIPVLYITELIALSFGYSPSEIGLKFHTIKLKTLFPESK